MQQVLRHLRDFCWPKEVHGNYLCNGKQMENALGAAVLWPGAGVAASGRTQTHLLAFGVRAFAPEKFKYYAEHDAIKHSIAGCV